MRTPLLLFLAWATLGWAQVPAELLYQGVFTDSFGERFTTSTQLTFRFYDDAAKSTLLHTEIEQVTSDEHGVFRTRLGTDTSLPSTLDSTSSKLHLTVQLEGLPEPASASPVSGPPTALRARLAGARARTQVILVEAAGTPSENGTALADAIPTSFETGPDAPYLIRLGPGVYENNSGFSLPDHVHLEGAGPGSTILTGSASGAILTQSEVTTRLEVRHLTISNAGPGPAMVAVGEGRVVNCRLLGSAAEALQVLSVSDVTLLGSELYSSGSYALRYQSAGAATLIGSHASSDATDVVFTSVGGSLTAADSVLADPTGISVPIRCNAPCDLELRGVEFTGDSGIVLGGSSGSGSLRAWNSNLSSGLQVFYSGYTIDMALSILSGISDAAGASYRCFELENGDGLAVTCP